jgi:GTP cyclohydrolase III
VTINYGLLASLSAPFYKHGNISDFFGGTGILLVIPEETRSRMNRQAGHLSHHPPSYRLCP